MTEKLTQFYPLNRTQAIVHSLCFEELDGEGPQLEIGDLLIKRTSSGSSVWFKELNDEISELARDHKLRFLASVRGYEDVFAKNETDLGLSDLTEHEIDTGNHKPTSNIHGDFHLYPEGMTSWSHWTELVVFHVSILLRGVAGESCSKRSCKDGVCDATRPIRVVSNAIWSYQHAENLTTDEHGSTMPNVEILPCIPG